MRWLLLVLVSGCWTGSETSPQSPTNHAPEIEIPSSFEITLERTPCLGTCPYYTVSVDGDGRVKWKGDGNVEAIGERRATVPQKRVKELERKLDQLQFFDRDERGELAQAKFDCVKTGNSTSCSFSSSVTICSDTTQSIITVKRGGEKHKITNDHCDESPLDELELLIDDVARTSAWIGKRVLGAP